MSESPTANLGPVPAATATNAGVALERRLETRSPLACDLWMIDHQGATVLRCHCMEVSRAGMRLRVPLGYGVAEGQRYELRSHLPGAHGAAMLGLVSSRWATVVRTQLCLGEQEDHVDVGVVLDVPDRPGHLVS